MAETDPGFAQSRAILQERLTALPGQFDAEAKGLEAKAEQGRTNILNAARRRGTGIAFGGIPIGEQLQYDATEFMPAMARLKGQQHSSELSIRDTLAGLDREQRTQAFGIREGELARAEQQRQFNESLGLERQKLAASKAAAAMPTLNMGGNQASQSGQAEKTYIGNDDFRGFLAYEANRGNTAAGIALKYAGNDGRYDGPVANMQEFNALKQAGIVGNYYMPGLGSVNSNTGLGVLSGGGIPAGMRF